MWCTTECWNCEDKTCEHYFSKQDIYFKNKKIQSNWNSLRGIIEDYLKEYGYDYNKLTMKKDIINVNGLWLKFVLDKMNELEGE